MALAVAPSIDASAATVFEEAGQQLRATKTTEIGTFHLFGRTLEWKRVSDAEELKNGLVKLVKQFGYSADFIHDLASILSRSLLGASDAAGQGSASGQAVAYIYASFPGDSRVTQQRMEQPAHFADHESDWEENCEPETSAFWPCRPGVGAHGGRQRIRGFRNGRD